MRRRTRAWRHRPGRPWRALPAVVPFAQDSTSPMPPKRDASAAGLLSAPLADAFFLSAALGFGVWILVARGRMDWPPTHLLSNAYTLAGCLALVGPVVLLRREPASSGLGELLWMTGGALIWLFDAAAALRGNLRAVAWTNPVGYQTMGLTILAVLLAARRARGAERDWTWTNVVGWILGLFWIATALFSLLPRQSAWVSPR
jgi:hypothetical protein